MIIGRSVFFKVKSPEEDADFVLCHSFFDQNGKGRPAKLGLIIWHSQNSVSENGGLTSRGWPPWVTPTLVPGHPRIFFPPLPLHVHQGKHSGRDLASLPS